MDVGHHIVQRARRTKSPRLASQGIHADRPRESDAEAAQGNTVHNRAGNWRSFLGWRVDQGLQETDGQLQQLLADLAAGRGDARQEGSVAGLCSNPEHAC